jgi:quercetin dioxygenase-like cupin family protein
MPQSVIISSSANTSLKVLQPTGTFTGGVYLEMVYTDQQAALANVTFTPCARTHWHTHEGGQVIRVLHRTGWICDKGEEARRIVAGDVIWAPAGTTHWHGADDWSVMTHSVVGLGATEWHDAVTDAEYKRRSGA